MATWSTTHSIDPLGCWPQISPCGTTGFLGHRRCGALCEHASHQNGGTRLCTADNQPRPQIQTTKALFSEGFWRTNIRWPCRHGSSSAIPEADLRKIRTLAPQYIVKEGPAPNFQIMVANGQLETPKSTVELKFEVGDIEFHEIFKVME